MILSRNIKVQIWQVLLWSINNFKIDALYLVNTYFLKTTKNHKNDYVITRDMREHIENDYLNCFTM
jgi:hypothetical protein